MGRGLSTQLHSRARIRPLLGSITPNTVEEFEITKLGLKSLCTCSKVSTKKKNFKDGL